MTKNFWSVPHAFEIAGPCNWQKSFYLHSKPLDLVPQFFEFWAALNIALEGSELDAPDSGSKLQAAKRLPCIIFPRSHIHQHQSLPVAFEGVLDAKPNMVPVDSTDSYVQDGIA